LPEEIAPTLKTGEKTIADCFHEASILFADIVGFTGLSASMDPAEMVDLLYKFFSHFDSLVEKY
jgi:class 3 adenylate cyclase